MISGMNTLSSDPGYMSQQLPEIPADLAGTKTADSTSGPQSTTQDRSPGSHGHTIRQGSRHDGLTNTPTGSRTGEKLKRSPVSDRMLWNLLRAFEGLGTLGGTHSAGSGGAHASGVQDTNAQMLSIINDPTLSIEEKIVLVSGLIQEKTENDLEGLLRQQAGQAASGHATSGSGLGSAIGALVGGTAGGLAAGPAGAAAGASLGASVGGRIDSLTGSSKTGDPGNTGISGKNLEARIQLLMQRLNRTQTMLSNMLQAMHQTKRSLVQNIRV